MRTPSEPGHPLFLPEDDDAEPSEVSEIQIARIENGQRVFYPRLFPAAELQSLEQVVAELGGGAYELIARHEHRISSRRKYVLPGKPKPMYDEGRQEPTKETVSAPVIDPMAAMMGGSGNGSLMGLIMMMMQQMMQQQAAAAASQTQMFIAMMQGNQQSSSEEKTQARAELQANIERERINSERTMSLMREVMTSKPAGDSSAGFTQGVEFMRGFAQLQIEQIKNTAKGGDSSDIDWGSLIETLSTAVQMFGIGRGGAPGASVGLPEGIAEVAEAAQ